MCSLLFRRKLLGMHWHARKDALRHWVPIRKDYLNPYGLNMACGLSRELSCLHIFLKMNAFPHSRNRHTRATYPGTSYPGAPTPMAGQAMVESVEQTLALLHTLACIARRLRCLWRRPEKAVGSFCWELLELSATLTYLCGAVHIVAKATTSKWRFMLQS